MENLLEPTQTSPISPARLAANRANARKSTGPRTPQGKARSASNSLQHGLYSTGHFEAFLADSNLALAITDNLLAEHQPLTPTEHLLVHQLIHCQIRFLQMEALYSKASDDGLESCKHLALILRELDRLPTRMLRTLRALRAEQSARNENTEIEAIPDQPPLPESEFGKTKPTETKIHNSLHGNRIFQLFAERLRALDPHSPSELDLDSAPEQL